MTSAMIIAIAGVLTFAGMKTTYDILKILAGCAWVGLGVFWVYNPFTTAGSPPMVIMLVVTFMAGVSCLFWGFWVSKFTKGGQETGGRWRMPFMQTDDEEAEERQRSAPTRRERVNAYVERINNRINGGR